MERIMERDVAIMIDVTAFRRKGFPNMSTSEMLKYAQTMFINQNLTRPSLSPLSSLPAGILTVKYSQMK